jgi:hypothetical protein
MGQSTHSLKYVDALCGKAQTIGLGFRVGLATPDIRIKGNCKIVVERAHEDSGKRVRLRIRLEIAHFDAESQSCRDSQSNTGRNAGNSLRFLCVLSVFASKFVNFQTQKTRSAVWLHPLRSTLSAL